MNRHNPLTLAAVVLLFATSVTAGPITDTTNNSFIDDTTGLEWMDFGVNNGQSFNYVASQLGVGGQYTGWQLPTMTQVYTLWANAFLGTGAQYTNANHFGAGQLFTHDGEGVVGSVYSATFEAMGYNEAYNVGTADEQHYAFGWFEGTNGLALVHYNHFPDTAGISQYRDIAQLRDNGNYEAYRNSNPSHWSTMLVRAASVPAPSAIGFLSLGLIGLVLRRRKHF